VAFAYAPSPSAARRGLDQAARLLQDTIAKQFEVAQTYAGPLAPNTTAYNIRKVLQGLDIRRGHRSGRLQNALYGVRAWTVRGGGKRWTISFDDAAVRARVPYARYYIQQKTPGQRIMGVQRSWLPQIQPIVDAIEAGARTRDVRVAPTTPRAIPTTFRRLVEFITGES
jgi:hypothetical protein